MESILLFVLSSFVVMTVYSQNNAKYSVSGGILGAANFSKFKTKNDNPTIDYGSNVGWSAGGWLNLPLSRSFSIEPQLLYSMYEYETSSTSPVILRDGKISYISLPILLKVDLGTKFAITAGPQFDFVSSVHDNTNVAQKSDFKSSSFSLFGGIEIFPHDRVSFFGRYIAGLNDMENRTNHPAVEYRNQNLQVGLKLKLFGGKRETYKATETVIPDSDGDGIADDVDKCPNVPGVAKYNGCPVPDSDGDGINDELDKCPNVAGVAKYDGCPIPDSDNDGINDEEDKCPNVAGLAKYNGCPAPDRDNDGISDDEDKCPDIAGIASNNGCPEVPANVSKSIGVAAQGITFGTGTSTKLSTRSNASLDKVVTIMNENPGLNIRVEGHTDNTGNADASMKLSQDRAQAVKDYLVSKGISADRITVEGFGGTQPISDNTSAAGRTKNNRIEIRMNY